jgi:hypothetical protein
VQDVKLDIGLNGAFLTRRWEEPDNFMRLTRELGYPAHEFCADVLDPFFSGDRGYQLETAHAVKAAAGKYGIVITDIYTGVATHRFHGLAHRHPSVRARMREWICQCMDLALAMGTTRIGGHWDALSVETLADPAQTRKLVEEVHRQFRELALIAKKKGLAALYNEQMYIPSEKPWTLAEAQEFLVAVNRGSEGVPIYLTVDVGHQAGMHYGLSGPDLDYLEWLRRFAAFAEIIHLQQTTPEASHHWPLTPEYNSRGCVQVERVIEAIAQSHRDCAKSRVSAALRPVKETWLIAEIIPGSTKTEEKLLGELRASCEHLRHFIPAGGLNF